VDGRAADGTITIIMAAGEEALGAVETTTIMTVAGAIGMAGAYGSATSLLNNKTRRLRAPYSLLDVELHNQRAPPDGQTIQPQQVKYRR
jgi:hypothetical protein